MVRVAINPEAAEWAAVRLANAAADLRIRADNIARLAHAVGRKDSPAPNDVFRAAELLQALSRDLRTRAAIARAAETRGWVDPILNAALRVPTWAPELELLRRSGHEAYWGARRTKELVDGGEIAIGLTRRVGHEARLASATVQHALADKALWLMEGRRLTRAERERREVLRARRALALRRVHSAEEAARKGWHESQPLTEIAVTKTLASSFPRMAKTAKIAGPLLGEFTMWATLVDLGRDTWRHDWGGAASNTATLAGTAMVAGTFLEATGVGAPIGAVLIAGSLIYENRAELAKAASWVARKISRSRRPEDADVVGG